MKHAAARSWPTRLVAIAFGAALAGSGAPARAQVVVPNGEAFQVTAGSPIYTSSPRIAGDGANRYVVTWNSVYEGDLSHRVVRARLFALNGGEQGDPFLVSPDGPTSSNSGAEVAMDAYGSFAVTWQWVFGTTGVDDQVEIRTRFFDESGQASTGALASDSASYPNWVSAPSVAAKGIGSYVVAWEREAFAPFSPSSYETHARLYNSGTAVGGPIEVTSIDRGDQVAKVGADALGRFVVAWAEREQDEDFNITAARVRFQRYHADGDANGDPVTVHTGTSVNPEVKRILVHPAGWFVVVFRDGPVFARTYSVDGEPLGDAFSFPSPHSAVTMNSEGVFVRCWYQSSDEGLVGQLLASDGSPLSPVFPVSEGIPAVCEEVEMVTPNRFVVAWLEWPHIMARSFTIVQDGGGSLLRASKRDLDLDGGLLLAGDRLRYTIVLQNDSDQDVPFELVDPIPAGTAYALGSLTVDGEAESDDAGDGIGFDAASDSVVIEIGVPAMSAVQVRFEVDLDGGLLPGAIVSNQATGPFLLVTDDPDTADPDDPTQSVVGTDVNGVDGDGVTDPVDNCRLVPNPDQTDTNQDGFGNACDPDYDDNGTVGISDLSRLRGGQFGLTDADPGFDPVFDMDGDGVIGMAELNLLRSMFGKAPGPSGYGCAGTVPCP